MPNNHLTQNEFKLGQDYLINVNLKSKPNDRLEHRNIMFCFCFKGTSCLLSSLTYKVPITGTVHPSTKTRVLVEKTLFTFFFLFFFFRVLARVFTRHVARACSPRARRQTFYFFIFFFQFSKCFFFFFLQRWGSF